MSKYLLDSNAVADCIFQRRGVDLRAMQARRQGHVIGTTLPVIAEMLGGIEFSQTREQNLLILNRTSSPDSEASSSLFLARGHSVASDGSPQGESRCGTARCKKVARR